MLGKFIITNHALERYEQRTNESKTDVKQRIIRDLRALRNKKIIHIGSTKHVFYTQPSKNVREFIIEESKGKLYVTTIINRSPEKSEKAYKKRLEQKEQYERNLLNEKNKSKENELEKKQA